MSLAHLYKLPIAVWEAQNSLLTTTSEALAQAQLEGVLEYELNDHMTAETVGAVFALFDLDGQVNEVTGLDVVSPKTIKRFAADFTERCTNTQLSTLADVQPTTPSRPTKPNEPIRMHPRTATFTQYFGNLLEKTPGSLASWGIT